MKRFLLCAFALCVSNCLHAEDSMILVSSGTTQGRLDYQNADPLMAPFDQGLDHDLTGTAQVASFMKIADSGFTWGFGQHKYEASGKSKTITERNFIFNGLTLSASTETTSASLSGMYGMVGYDLGSEDFHLIPQMRIGIDNRAQYRGKIKATMIYEGETVNGTSRITESAVGTTSILVLPCYLDLGFLVIGVEVHSLGTELHASMGTVDYVATFGPAVITTVGIAF